MANIIWDPYAKTFRDTSEYLRERDEYYANQENAIKASEQSPSMGDFRQIDAASNVAPVGSKNLLKGISAKTPTSMADFRQIDEAKQYCRTI